MRSLHVCCSKAQYLQCGFLLVNSSCLWKLVICIGSDAWTPSNFASKGMQGLFCHFIWAECSNYNVYNYIYKPPAHLPCVFNLYGVLQAPAPQLKLPYSDVGIDCPMLWSNHQASSEVSSVFVTPAWRFQEDAFVGASLKTKGFTSMDMSLVTPTTENLGPATPKGEDTIWKENDTFFSSLWEMKKIYMILNGKQLPVCTYFLGADAPEVTLLIRFFSFLSFFFIESVLMRLSQCIFPAVSLGCSGSLQMRKQRSACMGGTYMLIMHTTTLALILDISNTQKAQRVR